MPIEVITGLSSLITTLQQIRDAVILQNRLTAILISKEITDLDVDAVIAWASSIGPIGEGSRGDPKPATLE